MIFMATSKEFPFDSGAVDAAEKELLAALDSLPAAVKAAYRVKALSVLVEKPALFFVTKLELTGTGPAYNIATARLEPQQRYFDLISAVRAQDLDRYIEQTCG